MPTKSIHFGSDNYAGAHPAVIDAIVRANSGHVPGYGDDPITAELEARMREIFGPETEIYPVFNGTGANVVSLQAMLPRWGAALITASAHVNTDENAAPERVAGIKLLPQRSADGRFDPAQIAPALADVMVPHSAEPLAVSFSNSTEFGTVHSLEQVAEITSTAHRHGLLVHCDGSRLANAAVALGTDLATITADVDVISLGATKLGALGAEMIVVRNPDAVRGIDRLRKIDLQLASKQRFLSAQLLALYGGELWRELAGNANAQAARLAAALREVPGVSLYAETEANAVFATLPVGVADAVRERGWRFYDWPAEDAPGTVRLMTAWDTTDAAVDDFVADIAEIVGGGC